MNDILHSTIAQQRLIRLSYSPGWRTIEPHAFGMGRRGNELLRAYQTEGASESGEHINWKLFNVDEIDQIELLEETFAGPRPGYRRGDRAMARIYCQL